MGVDNRLIAKNTLFLYFRMLFTTIVALYTSRVILNTLGIEDFGLYQTVGGIVGLISFANTALTMGSSRFLTYELGTKDFEKLKKTFSTSFFIHFILALLIAVVAETAGLWYLYNKLVVPEARLEATIFVFHVSVLTSIITITQVPYTASIVSHERMKIYAYVSIVEVSLKLIIVYLLCIAEVDKLKFYAILLFIVHFSIAVYYRFYCVKNFSECRLSLVLNKDILKKILSYSGWNLVASTSMALCNHGILVLMNMFFSPSVVASKAIANQVNSVANQFVGNFKLAVDPQIIKQFAAENYEESQKLLLESAKISYYLMLILCVPVCMVADSLLRIWLGVVPKYATEFLQLAVITSLMETLNRSFYTALYAKGRIKENANIFSALLFISFVVVLFLFKMGFSPISSMIVMFVAQFIMSVFVKPVLLVKIVNYPAKLIFNVILTCLKVSLVAWVFPLLLQRIMNMYDVHFVAKFLIQAICSVFSVAIVIWFCGLNSQMKQKVLSYVKKKKGA